MNILTTFLRILSGIILIIGFFISYIISLTIAIMIIMQISIILCNINIIFYDIIKNIIMIMILGNYDIIQ